MRAIETVRSLLEHTLRTKGYRWPENAEIAPPKDARFGDLSCNAAMILAKQAKIKPRDLAESLAAAMLGADPPEPSIERIEVAGPGFLNFHLTESFWRQTVLDVLAAGERYGASGAGAGRKVQIEFVSANPTGPLHIGHGRGAALGDALARILRAAGYDVATEYYVNDAGRQMRLLGDSVWSRYQQACGRAVELIEDGYKGDYISDLARDVIKIKGASLLEIPEDEARAFCREFGAREISEGIRADLADFRVGHDVWFSELSLVESGTVNQTLERLKSEGLAYEMGGALYFDSTRFGDDMERVLRKSSGELTYLASDIAYHADKIARGFDLLVDIWGADHHGYVARLKAAVSALGRDPDMLAVILVQLVSLSRRGEKVAMSTRAGEFVTLRDVVAEVGVDSARFMFLSRKSDSQLDFDLELVKEQSMENPVFYVQYAHARVRSLFAKAGERGLAAPEPRNARLDLLDTPEDGRLLRLLEQYPDTVAAAAASLSPHLVSFYLRELAGALHRYYTAHQVLAAPDPERVRARMLLFSAVATVVRNGLALLGVDAPDSMRRATGETGETGETGAAESPEPDQG
ncbi:MAG: arginine--tRNA ligase [Desulfovibrionaceae bacterium]|nr:arginine--tRNA ligase [Desulfovibrionaceae bacterium]MBF0514709.1 arginine--tRNA ligase [Desulfovibrionaceae bacterium]